MSNAYIVCVSENLYFNLTGYHHELLNQYGVKVIDTPKDVSQIPNGSCVILYHYDEYMAAAPISEALADRGCFTMVCCGSVQFAQTIIVERMGRLRRQASAGVKHDESPVYIDVTVSLGEFEAVVKLKLDYPKYRWEGLTKLEQREHVHLVSQRVRKQINVEGKVDGKYKCYQTMDNPKFDPNAYRTHDQVR